MPAKIILAGGQIAIVDPEDFDRLNCWRWHLNSEAKPRYRYPVRRIWRPTESSLSITMSRAILGLEGKTALVLYKNRNGLDNRRENLVVASRHQVQGYCRKIASRAGRFPTSRFKGVYLHRLSGKWCAAIKIDGKTNFLGYFEAEEEAAAAYERAASDYFGAFAFCGTD